MASSESTGVIRSSLAASFLVTGLGEEVASSAGSRISTEGIISSIRGIRPVAVDELAFAIVGAEAVAGATRVTGSARSASSVMSEGSVESPFA